MFKFISKILVAPFDWFVSLIAGFIFVLFYGQLVITPTILLALLSSISFNFLLPEIALNFVYLSAFLGAVLGFVWAEYVRKKYSIFGFLGYIAGHPEIDGRQQPEKGIVFRDGNLTERST